MSEQAEPTSSGGPGEPEDDDATCVICLSKLPRCEQHCLVGCGHAFHAACIIPALQHNRSCPICRYAPPVCEVSSDEDDEDDEDEEDDESNRT